MSDERTLPELRADVELLDATLATLERDLEAAVLAEDAYREQWQALNGQIAALCGRYRLRTVEDPSQRAPMVVGDASDAVKAEVRALAQQRRELEGERARWITAHSVQATDKDGWPVTKSLTPSDVARRLKVCREVRATLAHELGERESRLTPGELVASGRPAPEYEQWRREVETLRSRLRVLEGG